ncbi:anti-sigma factor family protein [Paenibacillus ferrarius]|uniref:anti-sigma factor family protein n=1 Tax=Paenibacillus ferrarius TaxID=1469647 RepID=UPI003D2B1DA5
MIHHPEDQLSAYLDDELSAEEKQAVEMHLESCESCRALLDEWLALQVKVHDIFQFKQAPPAFEEIIMQTIEKNHQRTSGKRWLALPLIAIMLVCVIGIATGAMFLKFIHGFARLFVAILYMVTHIMSGVPLVYFTVIALSVLVLIASLYSLRRAFQITSLERG